MSSLTPLFSLRDFFAGQPTEIFLYFFSALIVFIQKMPIFAPAKAANVLIKIQ